MPSHVVKDMIDGGEERCAEAASTTGAVCLILGMSDAPKGLVQAYQDMADFYTKMKGRFRELAIEHAAKEKAGE